jgi:hypothetical protein
MPQNPIGPYDLLQRSFYVYYFVVQVVECVWHRFVLSGPRIVFCLKMTYCFVLHLRNATATRSVCTFGFECKGIVSCAAAETKRSKLCFPHVPGLPRCDSSHSSADDKYVSCKRYKEFSAWQRRVL